VGAADSLGPCLNEEQIRPQHIQNIIIQMDSKLLNYKSESSQLVYFKQ
jgi:hypothetical protein